jgi:hypothetical protein
MVQRAMATAHRECSGDAIVRVQRSRLDGLDNYGVRRARIR